MLPYIAYMDPMGNGLFRERRRGPFLTHFPTHEDPSSSGCACLRPKFGGMISDLPDKKKDSSEGEQ